MYGNFLLNIEAKYSLIDKPQHLMYGNLEGTKRELMPLRDKPQHLMYGNWKILML